MTLIRETAVVLTALWLGASALAARPAAPPRLRVLTVNVWSGLDYEGFAKFGEYEPRERREHRFTVLVDRIKALAPDIVFLQEANTAARFAARLAGALGFTEIHQVENGGIKLGPLGVPSNFKEGMAILARPSLRLRRHDVWKLSGPFGLFGDFLTFHFAEAVFSLVGKVIVDETPIFLVNVHLVASAADDEALFARFRETLEGRALSPADFAAVVAETKAKNRRRLDEARKLLAGVRELPADSPVIVAGDFNADPETPAVRAVLSVGGMIDTLAAAATAGPADGAAAHPITWDAGENENIAFSSRPVNASGAPRPPLGLLDAFDCGISRRLDYIVLNKGFRPEDVASSSVAVDAPESGIHASDHYGVFAEIDLERILASAPKEPATVVPPKGFGKEFFPILMWDTDIGFGYGAKGFLLNPLGLSESFDLTAFNSTKGERWYRFVFSLPDFETRQGKIYPLAFDLTIDYDKMIKNNFFGVGNASLYADRVSYTREPVEISLTLSRGFTATTVGQAGLKYATVRNSPPEGLALPSGLDIGRASSVSIFGNIRYDSRDSFIHPSEGIVLQAEAEYAPKAGAKTVSFTRVAGWFQYYTVLFEPKTIFAFRFGGQNLFGDDLPSQVLLSLGGNNTLRGSPQDRYLDKSHLLMNAEVRFPITGRLGGVVGLDMGKVWPSLGSIDFRKWAANPTLGLRYYMKTFVVRMDVGLGADATGLYFNFGHIF
ncbi:MAG: endonuclease/exonuclease/phosphatase family protein [Candidatus Aminicenantales bacterium]